MFLLVKMVVSVPVTTGCNIARNFFL